MNKRDLICRLVTQVQEVYQSCSNGKPILFLQPATLDLPFITRPIHSSPSTPADP